MNGDSICMSKRPYYFVFEKRPDSIEERREGGKEEEQELEQENGAERGKTTRETLNRSSGLC